MTRFIRIAALVTTVMTTLVTTLSFAEQAVLAAPAAPSVSRALPAGGQRGTEVEVAVSGANLGNVVAARFSGGQISASVLENKDDKSVKLKVAIPSDSPLGDFDLRLLTAGGVSNRLHFVVGDLAERNEAEPNSEAAQAQAIDALPAVVNGDISATDIDLFRFAAKAGETFVFELRGRRLHPFMKVDDRVGWFDACLTLYDAAGNEIAFVDDFRDDPDPVLIHKFEQEGEYVIGVRDTLYRGRAEFVYRLRMGVVPFITHVYPLGWHRHSYARVQVFGANVPAESVFTIPPDAPSLHEVRVSSNGFLSNASPFAVDNVSELFEAAANDTPEQAQRVVGPVAVNGRIESPNDQDCVAFTAAKGERWIVEVAARRFGSPLDALVQILNAQGSQLAANDDAAANPTQLHRADARLDFTVPADGDYVIRVRDFLNQGGDDFAYRLTIAPPTPQFDLELTPDNPRLEQGGTCTLTVNITRIDGFNEPVVLYAENLPAGITATPARIAPGQNSALMTLTAGHGAPFGVLSLPLQIVGRSEATSAAASGPAAANSPAFAASSAGGLVSSSTAARPAQAIERLEYVSNQFQNVPVKEGVLSIVAAPAPFQLAVAAPDAAVRQEGKLEWKVTARRRPGIVGPIALSVQGLPGNVSVPGATIAADQNEATLTFNAAANAVLGVANVVVEGKLTTDKEQVGQASRAVALSVEPK